MAIILSGGKDWCITFLLGYLSLMILSAAATLAAAMLFYKAAYVLYNTMKYLNENTQLSNQERDKLLLDKKYQIQSVKRAAFLFAATSLALVSLAVPGIGFLGLLSFFLVAAITTQNIQAIRNKRKEKIELKSKYSPCLFPPPRLETKEIASHPEPASASYPLRR